jgi:O-antigen ligase
MVVVTYLTHNIVVDLLLRTGAVGLALFLLAVIGSLSQAFMVWRYASDAMVAATALASVTIIAGWLAHGLVESLFEHVQLAPLFGITIGLAQAAASQLRELAEVYDIDPADIYDETPVSLSNVALSS